MADEKDKQEISVIKHDIRNQLSNINLALVQLKYEVRPMDEDIKFYLETISMGCAKINELLKGLD